MKKFNICKLILMLGLALAQYSKDVHAISIDEFEGDASLTATTNNTPLTTVTFSNTAIGGSRSLYVNKTAGTGDILLRTVTGRLKHDQGNDDKGVSIIVWDGSNGTPGSPVADNGFPSNPMGLGGIDLTEDNDGATKPADSFKLKLTADLGFNQPITLRFYVYSNASSASQASITINSDLATVTDVVVPFANFTAVAFPGITSPASFNDVGAIVLEIAGTNAANDIDIRSFGTNGECENAFPENGSVYDQCGVCVDIGDGTSCLDCKGVPFGPAVPGTACDTGDVGICQSGKYEVNCVCKNDNNPGTEICDGLDNDCDGQTDEITDVCGICGGDGKSCLDCAGKPFGTTVIDQCGVCGGNGTSCLDCASNPFGTAVVDQCGVCNGDNTSCIKCEDKNISELQFQLDHGAKLQERLIKQMLKVLTNKDKSKATMKYAKATATTTHTLQLRNWTLSWTPPSIQRQCDNQVICTQISNEDVLSEYRTHSLELRDIGLEIIAKLKKLKINVKKYTKQNQTQHDANMKLLAEVPLSRSVGC